MARSTTLAKVGRYAVEQIPCPHSGTAVDGRRPPAGVLHTTEGTWASAISVFRQHFAPHFLVGHDGARVRVAQLMPLGLMASALENPPGGVETNRWAAAQIEVVGFSKETPWSLEPHLLDALAELLLALRHAVGIPLSRPFVDGMPPLPWATPSFARRHANRWGKTGGWYGHVEIPENSHWDPGALRWHELIDAAKAKAAPPPPPKPVPPPARPPAPPPPGSPPVDLTGVSSRALLDELATRLHA